MNTSGSSSLRSPPATSSNAPTWCARREAHDEVGALAVELLDDLAGDLADGLEGQRVQRQRRRVAVHEIHATRGFGVRSPPG